MTLLEMIQPGHAVRVYFGPDNAKSYLAHIRAIVDGDQIIFRSWLRRRQFWRYHVESMYYFELMAKDGRLKLVSRGADETESEPQPLNAERDRIVRLLADAQSLHLGPETADLLTALAACVRNPALTIGDAYRVEREEQTKRRGY